MKNLLSTVLEAGKSKLKVLAFPFLGEGSLPGLQITPFLLYPYMDVKGKTQVSFSSYKDTNPMMWAVPSQLYLT